MAKTLFISRDASGAKEYTLSANKPGMRTGSMVDFVSDCIGVAVATFETVFGFSLKPGEVRQYPSLGAGKSVKDFMKLEKGERLSDELRKKYGLPIEKKPVAKGRSVKGGKKANKPASAKGRTAQGAKAGSKRATA